MRQLVLIGALTTGASIDLVTVGLTRGFGVTVITGSEDPLIGVFPANAKVVTLHHDVEEIICWIKHNFAHCIDDVVVTTARDSYAQLAGEVCVALDLPGPSMAALINGGSKIVQKKFLYMKGLPTPKSVSGCLRKISDIGKNIEHLSYPIVAKPAEGSGSRGVRLCTTEQEIVEHLMTLGEKSKRALEYDSKDDFILEEFVRGKEYCMEFFDGKFVGALRKMKQPGEHFYERGYTSDLELTESERSKMIEIGLRTVFEAELDWGPVHLDCVVTDNGPKIIEINPRIAGSFICELIKDAYGFDIVSALLDKITDERIDVPKIHKPISFARVDFFLNNDPVSCNFPEFGDMSTDALKVFYGPQRIDFRDRRAFLYVSTRSVAHPVGNGTLKEHEKIEQNNIDYKGADCG